MVENGMKPITDYQVYVVDMDGTLYYKRSMQIKMAYRLLGYYLTHFHQIKELFLLRDYRKLRDLEELSDKADIEEIIQQKLSRKYRYSQEKVRRITEKWILKRPLDILYQCRDKRLICFLDEARQNGKRVYIYSDYPAKDKCDALGICVDGLYWPDGKHICVLKPSADALRYILDSNGADYAQVLMIGDREEKDGCCAARAQVDYLILKTQPVVRMLQYRKLSVGGDQNE